MMGDPLGSSCLSSQKQNREGVVRAQSGQYRAMVKSNQGCGGGSGRDVTIWYQSLTLAVELTGFEFHWNSEVKRVARESTPMMGDPLGSSRVSSQKQNREGVVGAQSGQYRAMVVERARDVVDPGPGCDKNP
ncbi:hypothetical protein DVH24_031919 [Malus domestica]|uniref:Uncharacterized protein n=1 Tax=Malus domestica TaxID=3750 RepID=A0A498J6U4_MALDO|nr:hypothetical protein DVH24_031919 [Malus domestica]